MSYKIAIASSDEINIDETFGAAKRFLIYEIAEEGYHKIEERSAISDTTGKPSGESDRKSDRKSEAGEQGPVALTDHNEAVSSGGGVKASEGGVKASDCGQSSGGCASGGCGGGSGCGGGQAVSEKVELISDCRCVVCKKIGFNIQKQLERKAISAFDVDCTIEEALKKISFYFGRMDRHQSLRGLNTSS